MIEVIVLAALWVVSVILAFTAGEMRGHSVSDKWWNQYGAQVFAEKFALIYGTALYKEPCANAALHEGEKK